MSIDAYIRLMRLEKPVGILLLWWPTACALWLSNSQPEWHIIALFFCGTILMRSAGCVINDIADRNIDVHVSRTKMRPLSAGVLSLNQAAVVLIVLLIFALLIALQLPSQCFYDALFAVFITILYPFCKRFFNAPQLILGLAFSAGIPMAYHAQGHTLNSVAYLLVLLNIAWTIAYDTLYAMVDREDDLRIGVRSTAILFARYDKIMIAVLQLTAQLLWLFIAAIQGFGGFFYLAWMLASVLFVYQQCLIRDRNRHACFSAFKSNQWYGLLMWLGVLSGC